MSGNFSEFVLFEKSLDKNDVLEIKYIKDSQNNGYDDLVMIQDLQIKDRVIFVDTV